MSTEAAQAYLEKIDKPVEGQRNATLNRAAFMIAERFQLSAFDHERLLTQWAATFYPPLPVGEVARTIRGAYNSVSGSAGVGSKARPDSPRPVQRNGQTNRSKVKYDTSKATDAPEELTGFTTADFLKAVFKPGEFISIAGEVMPEGEEKGHPLGGGTVLKLEEWVEKLAENNNDPNEIFKNGNGAFIRINPMRQGGSKDMDVASYRHALVEFDNIELAQQWSLITQSGLPCACVIHSGRRSIHAWVRVDASSREEYDERVLMIFEHFQAYGVDTQNKNPSRFSRLPGQNRKSGKQYLVALKLGAADWADWVESLCENPLPKIVSFMPFLNAVLGKPKEVVTGLLHRGSKMVLGGGSKSFKTFALLDLAMTISHGGSWWGRPVTKGRALYVNFEIQDFFFRDRLFAIGSAKNFEPSQCSLDLWNLRGYSASLERLMPKILNGIRSAEYDAIFVDPIYKGLGGRDENSAGDMSELLNEVERLAVTTGAAVVFGAHFSKGNQAHKVAIDRIGGSGVFARDPDTILTMTPHSEDDCFVIDSVLRNFAPISPFVIGWEYPLFTPKPELDAEALKAPGAPETYSDDDLMEIFREIALSHNYVRLDQWLKASQRDLGIARATFHRRIPKLIEKGLVKRLRNREFTLPDERKSYGD